MKKSPVFLLILIVLLFGGACSLSGKLPKEQISAEKPLSDVAIDEVVQTYFDDEALVEKDAYQFLTGIGFQELSFSVNDEEVSIQFEQFDDLLPQQMQQRYLIAFLTAERYQPLCQTIQITVTVSGEPMVNMVGSCQDVRSWRHGEIDISAWFNRIKKQVVWDPPQTESKIQPPSTTQITDPYSWFVNNPQVLGAVFQSYDLPLSDPLNHYYSFYETGEEHICSMQTADGSVYEQFHEDSLLWINGAYDMAGILADYEQNADYVVADLEEGLLEGKRVVTWTVTTAPDFLRTEKTGYIELVSGSDEWFGFVVSETCVDQFGTHLPLPLELLQTLLIEMQATGYQ